MKVSVLLSGLSAFLFVIPAMAQTTITPELIQKFLNETTALTHIENKLADADIQNYLNDHIDEDGEFNSVVLFEMPGQPSTPRKMSLNKEQFIGNVITGRKQMRGYKSDVKLLTHKISGNGTSADVETATNESGEMPVNAQDYLPFEGTTICKQKIHVADNKLILKSADCESRLGFIE